MINEMRYKFTQVIDGFLEEKDFSAECVENIITILIEMLAKVASAMLIMPFDDNRERITEEVLAHIGHNLRTRIEMCNKSIQRKGELNEPTIVC